MATKKSPAATEPVITKPRRSNSKPATAPAGTKDSRKLVRDSFTMPKSEYVAIDALKTRALGLGRQAKKSEILRAGLRALVSMSDRSLTGALNAVPTLKTGRPKGEPREATKDGPGDTTKKAAKKAVRGGRNRDSGPRPKQAGGDSQAPDRAS
jgi:hypothetical protein